MTLTENGNVVASARYIGNGDGDWPGVAERVGVFLASNEEKEVRSKWADEFSRVISDLLFLPGGRTLRNSGNTNALLNCHVLELGDSMKSEVGVTGIGEFINMALCLNADGGGVGTYCKLRPKGAELKTRKGHSTGLISFLKAISSILDTVESGGNRRSGLLPILPVTHPEILDFIDAKLDKSLLNNFNVSVGVTTDFLDAVEQKSKWKFVWNNQEYGEIWAKDLFDKIVANVLSSGEPGLVNLERMRTNNTWYFSPVEALNLCVPGDTKIRVAGIGDVPIKQLAEDGKDVPVYCKTDDRKIDIQMMRHPRCVGKRKVIKVTFTDGSYIRRSDDHRIVMIDGSFKNVVDLVPGDRLYHMRRYESSFQKAVYGEDSSGSKYTWLANGRRQVIAEHRLLAKFKYQRDLEIGEVVHHKNFDSLDNSLDNLEVMLNEDHRKLHGDHMRGINNPVNRFPDKNWLVKQDWSGKNNGRFSGWTQEMLYQLAIFYSKSYGRQLLVSEWEDLCRERGHPSFTKVDKLYEEVSKLLEAAAVKAKVYHGSHLIAYKRYLELKKESDLAISWDEERGVLVTRICEYCGTPFTVPWGSREQSYCSVSCGNKATQPRSYMLSSEGREAIVNNMKLNNPMKDPETVKKRNLTRYGRASASYLNFEVAKVEYDGYEDVYTGTVDKYHNFHSLVKDGNYVCDRNCGELPLSKNQSCCLGSLVLPNFLDGSNRTKWDSIEETIRIGVRMLDDVLDMNEYPFDVMQKATMLSRRIGVGVMGLAEYLFKKGVRYGSEKGLAETEAVIKHIRNKLYEASIDLAIEKGAFPGFNSHAYSAAKFIKTLPARIRMSIKKHGIRNATLMAFAPTGTISLVADTTSGVEPLFSKAYVRRDRVGERYYIHPTYRKYLEAPGEQVPEWFVDAFDLSPEEHFETTATIQRLNDGSISKTQNLPRGTTHEQLNSWLLEYIRDLVGVTCYVDGSRDDQIMTPLSKEEALQVIKNEGEKLMCNTSGSTSDGSSAGGCDCGN